MRRIVPVVVVAMFAFAALAQNPECELFDSGAGGWTANNAVCSIVNGAMQCDDRSNASNFAAPAAFLGDWIRQVDGCGQLCFDINLITSGVPNAVPLRFTIRNGTHRASFMTTPLSAGSGWQTFCAPVFRTSTGAPPPSNVGSWVLAAGSDWNTLIANVTAMDFAIDIAGAAVFERIAFDNICFQATCPVAEFIWTGSDCEGQPLALIDQSRMATAWLWTFGASGAPSSTDPNPVVTLPPGTHAVTLCINGGNAAPLCVTHPVTVKRAPRVEPVTGSRNVCGRTTRLCAPFELKTGYHWTGSDVSITSGNTTRCITLEASGPSPSVTLTATSRNGCSRTMTIPLENCPTSSGCTDPPFMVRDQTFAEGNLGEIYTSTAVLDIAVPYKSIAMTLVGASQRFYDALECGGPFPMPVYLDNVQPANGAAPLATPPFPHEVIWPGGAAGSVTLTADIKGVRGGTLGGCNDELTFCVKYSVTTDDPSADCRTCEFVRCHAIPR